VRGRPSRSKRKFCSSSIVLKRSRCDLGKTRSVGFGSLLSCGLRSAFGSPLAFRASAAAWQRFSPSAARMGVRRRSCSCSNRRPAPANLDFENRLARRVIFDNCHVPTTGWAPRSSGSNRPSRNPGHFMLTAGDTAQVVLGLPRMSSLHML
jgi:hypothetical protein